MLKKPLNEYDKIKYHEHIVEINMEIFSMFCQNYFKYNNRNNFDSLFKISTSYT